MMVGVERTSSTAMIAKSTTAAVKPAAMLIGAKTRMPAPESPAATIQIQTLGQSFSRNNGRGAGGGGVGGRCSCTGFGHGHSFPLLPGYFILAFRRGRLCVQRRPVCR